MLTMELKQLTSTWQQNDQEQKSDFRCFGGLVYGEFVLLYCLLQTITMTFIKVPRLCSAEALIGDTEHIDVISFTK